MLTKLKSLLKSKMSPVSLRRIEAFQRNRRAVLSFKIFLVVFVLSLFSELICNDKPLILKYNNQLYFPVLNSYTDADFGGDFPTPADYKDKYLLENIEK